MYKEVIFGPPGTGKTTWLMQQLSKELGENCVYGGEIAFASFTRQGTYEGVARAIEQFKLNRDQSKFFRTIHSLCFTALGVNKSMMIRKSHYKLLSEKTGIPFTGFYTEDMSSTNDAYLHCYSMSKHNPKFAAELELSLNANKYAYIKTQYDAMKSQVGILDFDDLLLNYLKYGDPLPVKVAFIDEGQDLTPLQWKVIHKMFSLCDKIFVAGDDDQAVYEWSGADVTQFLSFSTNKTLLQQSYRLPKNVLKVASKITKDIVTRQSKKFKPRNYFGLMRSYNSIGDVDFKGGELVLARTNWILKQLAEEFSLHGIPYTYKGRPSIDKNLLKAIKAYIQYENGRLDYSEVKKFSTFFNTINDQPWQTNVKMPYGHNIQHYDNYIMLNGSASMEPVKFETFHSSKGSENDHVVLLPELSKKVHDHMFRHYDAELRCLYVGMTRTKKDLTILMPKGNYFYPSRYFGGN